MTAEAAIAINARPETRFDQIMAVHDPRTPGTASYIEIINSDGSRAQACGNGMRCVVQALTAEQGRQSFTFETVAGILFGEEQEDGLISVDMGTPRFAWYDIPLAEEFADTRKIELQIGPIDAPVLHSPAVASMGNPHATFWVQDDVWNYALDRFGPMLENHPIFPSGPISPLPRCWGPTASSAHMGARCGFDRGLRHRRLRRPGQRRTHRRTGRKATVTLPGGDLVVEWRPDDHVVLTGPAEHEWSGHLDPATGAWTRSEAA